MKRFCVALALTVLLLVSSGAAGGADGDAYLKTCYTTAPAGSMRFQ